VGRAVLGLAVVGTALLLAAWVVGTQPFGAPDEASHYLRALTLSQGHLLGRKVPYPNVPASPAQLAYVEVVGDDGTNRRVSPDQVIRRRSREASLVAVRCVQGVRLASGRRTTPSS